MSCSDGSVSCSSCPSEWRLLISFGSKIESSVGPSALEDSSIASMLVEFDDGPGALEDSSIASMLVEFDVGLATSTTSFSVISADPALAVKRNTSVHA